MILLAFIFELLAFAFGFNSRDLLELCNFKQTQLTIGVREGDARPFSGFIKGEGN